MKKQSSLINLSTLFIAIALVFVACNGKNSSQANSGPANSGSSAASPANQFTGTLDNLYTDSSTFLNLDNRVVFRFYIKDPSHLTLHGWFGGKNQKWIFDNPKHQLTLSIGSPSAFTYGPGDYFGDLILHHSTLAGIKSLIKQNQTKFVIFVPIDPAKATFPGQITYDIYLGNDPLATMVNISTSKLIATGVQTNPCPPGSGQ